LRGPWAELANRLDRLGVQSLRDRWEAARQRLGEQGVSYHVHSDPRGLSDPRRPAALDPLPVLLGPQQWAALEAGVIQRAALLDHVLGDAYGPQQLLTDVPGLSNLVAGVGGYQPGCRTGGAAPGGEARPAVQLTLYAVDLVRDVEDATGGGSRGGSGGGGGWRVVADHTRFPRGMAWALEHRLVVSRALPAAFRAMHVQRLAGFFARLQAGLGRLAEGWASAAQVVLLTPGADAPGSFEHAYLARYLGVPLVEAGDLTVRDDAVHLKTLAGLRRVDTLLRAVPDAASDPLELEASDAGVAGLVTAQRGGQVAVVNPIGSELMQSPAWQAVLPQLCQRVTGEPLGLGGVETWWAGDPEQRARVLEGLRDPAMWLRPADSASAGAWPLPGESKAEAGRELIEAVQRTPERWCLQRRATPGTAPVLTAAGRLEPGLLRLRLFAANDGHGWSVMPGGLGWVRPVDADDADSQSLGGAGAKDVWVLASGKVKPVTLLQPPEAAVTLSRAGLELPSRAADNLMWLGRYLERAEACCRLARGVARQLDREAEPAGVTTAALLDALDRLVHRERPEPWLPGEADAAGPGAEVLTARLLSLLSDAEADDGLVATLLQVDRLAGVLRDRMAVDSWRTLRQVADLRPRLERVADQDPSADPQDDDRLDTALQLLDGVLMGLTAYAGFAAEGMTRNDAWRMLDIGRRLERAWQTAGLLGALATPAQPVGSGRLEALLSLTHSTMTYRSRYRTRPAAAPLLDLLLLDETNPRSVAYQYARLGEHVDALPGQARGGSGVRSEEQRELLRSLSDVVLTDVFALAHADKTGRRTMLHERTLALQQRVEQLADQLTGRYLTHARGVRHV
jgi:uncharacterized circularly permuted ATP-grasp superfamily protein/uncharacterized alpha-E superfamily protein